MTRWDPPTPAPRNGSSVDSDTTEVQAVFLDLVESDPERPLSALAARGLAEPLRAKVERMLVAYMRARALEKTLMGEDGEVLRAMAEAGAAPRVEMDRTVPPRIRNYRVVRALAVGPGSAVVLAEQESPIEREVALKLIFEDGGDPRVAARVELERQILASLEHPNIARIYDFGLDERNRPYLVMEFVRGGAIDAWCHAHPSSPRAIVEDLFLPVCSALRSAHARGVLHCDLKCANVLVQEVDGVAHAKVIDFGIARATRGALAERADLADLPRALGTLRSLSPEALEPGGGRLDVRTDVFGLGLLLFELVSGRPARDIPSGDLEESLRRLLDDPVPSLRSLVPSVDVDLDAIVAKACARDPRARYESVDALVNDLEAWRAGRETQARRRGTLERSVVLVRRRWKVVAALAFAGTVAFAAPWIAAAPSRARLSSLVSQTESTLAAAREIRNSAGRGAEHIALAGSALDSSLAALELGGSTPALLDLRAQALEEAILPRLVRLDHKSVETVALVKALVAIRESLAASEASLRAKERLSVALAYQLDTVRYTDAYDALEARQMALDEELHAADPDSLVYADNLAWTYQRVYDPMWKRGEQRRSLDLLRRSDELGEEILAKHGSNAHTLYTAAAAAMYAAMAEEADWRPDELLDATARARAHAGELLKLSPAHHRGATFLLRAAVIEARARVERGEAREAAEMLAEARAIAAPAIQAERDVGFFGFPIADAFVAEARAWLAVGDADRAQAALDGLGLEMERERSGMQRVRVNVTFAAQGEMLRGSAALARGDLDAARERMWALLGTAHLQLAGDRGYTVEEMVLELAWIAERHAGDAAVESLVHDLARALEPELASTERGEEGSRFLRTSRVAMDALLGRMEEARSAAGEVRASPLHNPMGEANLRRVERWIGTRRDGPRTERMPFGGTRASVRLANWVPNGAWQSRASAQVQPDASLPRMDGPKLAALEALSGRIQADPRDARLWKDAILKSVFARNEAGPERASEPCVRLVATGAAYFTLSASEAVAREDFLQSKRSRTGLSPVETDELQKLSSSYIDALDMHQRFLVRTVDMLVDQRPVGPESERFICAAIDSPAGRALSVCEILNTDARWSDLPLAVQLKMLEVADHGQWAESISMMSICHQVGCPRERLEPAVSRMSEALRKELASRDAPGPVRKALREINADETPQLLRLASPISPELTEGALAIIRSGRTKGDEKAAAARIVHDMLQPEAKARYTAGNVVVLDETVLAATSAAIGSCTLSEPQLKQLEAMFRADFAGVAEPDVPSDQVIRLLSSPERSERAVGKMIVEALPRLNQASGVPRAREICLAARELENTPTEQGGAAAVCDYLSREFEHWHVRYFDPSAKWPTR